MLIEPLLREQIEKVSRRHRRAGLWGKLAACWAAAGLLGLGILTLEHESGWSSSVALPTVAIIGLAGAFIIVARYRKEPVSWRKIATQIESRHPELNGRLVTAVQLRPEEGGELNFLQRRLVGETVEFCKNKDWTDTIPGSRVKLAQVGHWIALSLFVVTLIALQHTGGHHLLGRILAESVTVTPGDVSLEKGTSLVVLARFQGALPPKVELVFGGSGAAQSIPLLKSLGDPMFGGSIGEVSSNFLYHVEYRGQRTRDFAVTVFEHPRLERADADLSFPIYTTLSPKRIENTRRVSAVEGSHLDLALQLNKAVSSARLIARDKEHSVIPLAIETNHPTASLKDFPLESSRTYDLQLVDSDGRTNKVPADFVFVVLKNRTPEMHLTSPRGDFRPSALEEIPFEGTVWDDFGIRAFGLAYAVNGQSPNFIELGKDVPGNEKRPFRHFLRLEDLGVKPDELVSWFVWSDDLGPDGQKRRTMGDLYFGEVRPFEEVFREGQGMEGQGGGESGGDRTGKLADLQKQIVNATWRLERDHAHAASQKAPERPSGTDSEGHRSIPAGNQSQKDSSPGPSARVHALPGGLRATGFGSHVMAAQVDVDDSSDSKAEPPLVSRPARKPSEPANAAAGSGYQSDAGVVLDSQAQALEQAREALRRQRNPQAASLWENAITEMETAIKRLQAATNSPTVLRDALAAEEAAYQALIRLEAHEYQVSRSRNRSQSGSSRNEQMQRQLEELDLKDSDNRYENQREAQRTQNPERREQLQVMSRLQELARRQQDLNDRLKELQTALQEARTEQEKAEIRRQLKRLQEEEQQMLADVDELRQRMDRPENQSRLADERRQLDQTRQEVQKAAEAAGQNSASQALAAGTRAQSQLQQLRDEIRKKSSSQFAEDMRLLRSQARELARQQDDILKKIQNQSSTEKKSLSDAADQEQTREALKRQKGLLTNLVEHATQVSQEAEQAEPLLAQQLYDTVRKYTQNTAKDLKEAQTDLLNRGPMTRSLFDLLRDDSEQGAVKLEEITSEMLRLGFLPQAGRVGERARTGIEDLKKGVERAAESVLGDDAEDLRLAQKQLDDLSKQLQSEISENQGGDRQTNGTPSAAGQSSAERADQAAAPGTGNKENESQGGQKLSQKGSPAQSPGSAQPNGNSPGAGEKGASKASEAQGLASQTGAEGGEQSGNEGSQPDGSAKNGSPNGPNKNPARRSANRSPREGTQGEVAGGGDPSGAGRSAGAGAGGRNWNWDQLRNESQRRENDPITGEGFNSWSDRLREVEELLDEPGLRDDVAKARERARLFRQDFKREHKKPDWAVLQLQIMKPLTEVRDRIADELARRESREALVPLDRDPVPNRYSDLVKRYYEELGKQK